MAEAGLDTATDRMLWECAGEHDFVIVSKDTDVRQLAFLYGPSPKVLWLRVGNESTTAIETLVGTSVARLEEFAPSDEESLLVLSPMA